MTKAFCVVDTVASSIQLHRTKDYKHDSDHRRPRCVLCHAELFLTVWASSYVLEGGAWIPHNEFLTRHLLNSLILLAKLAPVSYTHLTLPTNREV